MTMARAGVVMYGRTALLLRARVEGRKGGAVSDRRQSAAWQLTGSAAAAAVGRCGGTAGKNKAKENMRRGLPFDAVQSTAAKTPNYLRYQNAVPKGPKLNSETNHESRVTTSSFGR
jgi:hypothetical protein